MKTVFHSAASRGFANHGWLKAAHSFSFASYYDQSRVHFGLLRVLNDDHIAAAMGFSEHPHDNMEIVTIVLEGELEHKDTMGNSGILRPGDVQIMSAGSGLMHAEKNHSKSSDLKLLQIWVFPKIENITPRYDQKFFGDEEKHNLFKSVVSPDKNDTGAIWINQDSYFSLGNFDAGQKAKYTIKHPGNGVYVFLLDGAVSAAGQELERRDAVGVSETDSIDFDFKTDAKVLLIEVPMK